MVLISRTQSKLDNVAKEFGNKKFCSHRLTLSPIYRWTGALFPAIKIKTIAVDFTEGQSIYPTLQKELLSLDVGILINAVGMLVGIGKPYVEVGTDREAHDLINCNVMSMVRMNRIVLPQMLKRKKGIVVNIGSLSSTIPTPYLTLYGATKVNWHCFKGILRTLEIITSLSLFRLGFR